MADLSITAANVVKYSGSTTRTGTAGAAIAAGDTLYLDGTTLKLAQADSLVKAACVGIALNGAATGQPVTYLVAGGINPGAAVTVGLYYCVSDNAAGKIAPNADLGATAYPTGLGFATTTSRIEVVINQSGVVIAS
jgi:hypothetical protein